MLQLASDVPSLVLSFTSGLHRPCVFVCFICVHKGALLCMPPQAVEVAPEHLAKISTLLADSKEKRAREQESLARSEALLRKLVRQASPGPASRFSCTYHFNNCLPSPNKKLLVFSLERDASQPAQQMHAQGTCRHRCHRRDCPRSSRHNTRL